MLSTHLTILASSGYGSAKALLSLLVVLPGIWTTGFLKDMPTCAPKCGEMYNYNTSNSECIPQGEQDQNSVTFVT